ncbi:hypothetical protein VNO78_27012 [Psophocarpus tetragonolobus]|uniref:Uncharacterized protein n=1 Tax=Psophocarpus tetragonolobus TaxID=3891 RepID=A0AAN9S0L2_PSOTE
MVVTLRLVVVDEGEDIWRGRKSEGKARPRRDWEWLNGRFGFQGIKGLRVSLLLLQVGLAFTRTFAI